MSGGYPTRQAIKPGKVLYTDLDSGAPTGHGFLHGGDIVALRETVDDLQREHRLVFEDTLQLLDVADKQFNIAISFDERLSHRETLTVTLNGALIAGPERPVQAPLSTLTTEFGEGGFGQLGFGGSISVTG